MKPDGTPLGWDTSETIKYKVDAGGLGNLSYDESLALVQEAMAIWEGVGVTGIEFEYLGPTDKAITIDNWESIAANNIYGEGYGSSSGFTDSQVNNYIVIGFDNTGKIIKAKGSTGASGVQSHTGVRGTFLNPLFLISAHIFINGLYYNNDDSDVADLALIDVMAILVHEIGHALGLEHTIVHYQMYRDILNSRVNSSYARYIPVMFPRFIKGTGDHMITPNPDDIATLKWMYGAGNYQNISGDILDASGNPQYSLLVTARETSSSLCHVYSQATSITCSDVNTDPNGEGADYFNGKYCMDDDMLGYYTIPILEDGGYTIDVQEIPAFLASSITKFSSNVQKIPGDAEFYNSQDNKFEDAYEYDEIIIDGDDLDNIDINLSSIYAGTDHLERIEYTYFEEDDFFVTVTNGGDCPIINSFDIESVIEDTSASESSESSSNSSSGSSTGCSLNTSRPSSFVHRPSSNLLFVMIFGTFISFLIFRRIKIRYS